MAANEADRRLVAAAERIVDEDLPALIEEARQEARERVKAELVDALTEAMLMRAQEEIWNRAARRPADTKQDHPTHTEDQEQALYVYGVVAADTQLPPDLDGLDPDGPPTLITHDGLAAIVSKVPLRDFDEERLRERLGDLEWLERTARMHEGVLERVAQQTTLVPMRMCSVYRAEQSVVEMLMREETALESALAHLNGKTEWAVKVFAREAAMTAGEADEDPTSGSDYMRQRLEARDRRAKAGEKHHGACVTIHERLEDLVSEAVTAPVQRPEVSGHSGDMVLNGVYLVADNEVQAFLDEVEELQREFGQLGLELVPSGPWPAYNFVPGTIGAGW